MKNKTYTTWANKKRYKWLWVAALLDGIYFYKRKISEEKHDVVFKNIVNSAKLADERNLKILKNW